MDGWNREREREARKRGGGWIGYGRMDRWMDMERLMDGCIDQYGKIDGWMDGWMDGCMDGWMDGWTDG